MRHITVHSDITAVPRTEWDRCAAPADNPFISHAFLAALEQSGCVCAETGWQPQHLVLRAGAGAGADGDSDSDADSPAEILAVMPLYLKNHSQGEYVFDHSWADAYQRAGGEYYPKLQSSVPFTPVTGRRLLTPLGLSPIEQQQREAELLQGALQLQDKYQLSSLHLTFLTQQQAELCQHSGLLLRNDQQFHWDNPGYQSFDEFLGELNARKRKNLRKERTAIRELGLRFDWLVGSEISENDWDFFFRCYQDTGARKWGSPYLNRAFFSLLQQTMPDNLLLIVCRDSQNQSIACALNLFGEQTLYGRYWGCIEQVPFLHFETCYYQAIDFAIAQGLPRIEAGAQGAHKLARGYLPQLTYSAHAIAHQGFREAVERYLSGERSEVAFDIELLNQHSPFRKKQ